MAEDLEQRFKEASSELIILINKRRSSWKLFSVMGWDDVSNIILAEIWKSWPGYDPSKPLDRWANTVITSRMKNLFRDHLFKTARPCIAATNYGNPCSYNTGCDGCAWTKSGRQDSSCRFFAAWEKKKQAKFVVSTPLAMSAHVDEVHSQHSDYVDYEAGKKMIDEKIIPLLTQEEAKIYRFLYIKKLSMKETGKRMGYKVQKNSKIPGYLILRSACKRFYLLAKEIVETEGIQ